MLSCQVMVIMYQTEKVSALAAHIPVYTFCHISYYRQKNMVK